MKYFPVLAMGLSIFIACSLEALEFRPSGKTPGQTFPNRPDYDFSRSEAATIEVELTVPPEGFERRRQVILYKGSDTAENGWNLSWQGPADAENLENQALMFNLSLPDKDYRRYQSVVKLKPNRKATLTVTLDGRDIRFYQDGHLLTARSCSVLPPYSEKTPLKVGRYYHDKLDFSGEVNRVLIAGELRVPTPAGPLASLELPELYYRNFDLADRTEAMPAAASCWLTPEKIALARRNIGKYDWAGKLYEKILADADELAAIPAAELSWHIPEQPGAACHCPACGRNSEVAWRDFRKNDGRILACADCGTAFPNEKYPEDQVLAVKLPNGRVQQLSYHRGKSISGNEGDRYFLSGVIRERRLTLLMDKLPSLAPAYALTGEKKYAEAARNILCRLAEVYPGYPPRLRNTYFEDYGGNKIEGKFYRWKLGDNRYIVPLAALYDATRSSGVYSDAERLHIENGLFREYKRLMTAFPPYGDLTNALPFGYAGMAYVGRILGDHEMIRWVVRGPQSLKAFMDAWFYRDGFWHENSCSYQNMTLGYMHRILEGLEGYGDPPEYAGSDRFANLSVAADIPMLGKAYLAPAYSIMPDGSLPPFNDSPALAKYNTLFAEYAVRFFDSPEAREIFAFAGSSRNTGSIDALFNFDPEAMEPAGEPEIPAAVRESWIYPGPRWLVLRGGYGENGGALAMDVADKILYHVHHSSLNFIYYDYGRELVTDLGYLGAQHRMTGFNKSILAHNTVMVDGKPHFRKPGRRVEADFFSGASHPVYRAMRGHAPNAYENVEKFERTLFYVDRGRGGRYAVDFFEVKGGGEHVYLFHAIGDELLSPPGLAWQPFDAAAAWQADTQSKHLTEAKTARVAGSAVFRWEKGFRDGVGAVFQLPGNLEAECILADAPGNRNIQTPLSDRKMKLLLLRRQGPESCFTGLIAGYDGEPVERRVTLLPRENGRVLEVKTGDRTELFLISDGKSPLRCEAFPQLEFRGAAAVLELENRAVKDFFVAGGGELHYDGELLARQQLFRAAVAGFDEEKQTVTLDREVPGRVPDGEYLFLPAHRDGFYRVRAVDGNVVTVHDTAPFKLAKGDEIVLYLTEK